MERNQARIDVHSYADDRYYYQAAVREGIRPRGHPAIEPSYFPLEHRPSHSIGMNVAAMRAAITVAIPG